MLISAQRFLTEDNDEYVNVYSFVHATTAWPGDPAVAFDWQCHPAAEYTEGPDTAGGVIARVDVACPNTITPCLLYQRFRDYTANTEPLAGRPPFIWRLPPVAVRVWLRAGVDDWKTEFRDLLRHILLP